MTDARRLFRSDRRYRGFFPCGSSYVPVHFTVYPVDDREVRIKDLFPLRVLESLREGDTLYVLTEDRLVGELRVLRKGERDVLASLDFLTEDRRSLPRVKVEGILDVEVSVRCGNEEHSGKAVDLSLNSLSAKIGKSVSCTECEVGLRYGGRRVEVKGSVVRSAPDLVVLQILEGTEEMVDLLNKVYSDLLLKLQRSS